MQSQSFTVNAQTQSEKLRIENGRELMLRAPARDQYFLNVIELNLTVRTGNAEEVRARFLGVLQFAFGQIQRKFFVYAPQWGSTALKLLQPIDAPGPGNLNELVKF